MVVADVFEQDCTERIAESFIIIEGEAQVSSQLERVTQHVVQMDGLLGWEYSSLEVPKLCGQSWRPGRRAGVVGRRSIRSGLQMVEESAMDHKVASTAKRANDEATILQGAHKLLRLIRTATSGTKKLCHICCAAIQ